MPGEKGMDVDEGVVADFVVAGKVDKAQLVPHVRPALRGMPMELIARH